MDILLKTVFYHRIISLIMINPRFVKLSKNLEKTSNYIYIKMMI